MLSIHNLNLYLRGYCYRNNLENGYLAHTFAYDLYKYYKSDIRNEKGLEL